MTKDPSDGSLRCDDSQHRSKVPGAARDKSMTEDEAPQSNPEPRSNAPADASVGAEPAPESSREGRNPTLDEIQQMPLHERARLSGEPLPSFEPPAEPPLPVETMQALDRRTASAEYGLPSRLLMENAGHGAAELAGEMLDRTRPAEGTAREIREGRVRRTIYERHAGRGVIVFAGPGNNGGDGFVVARHLRDQGADVFIYLFATADSFDPTSDAGANLALCRELGIHVREIPDAAAIEAVENDVRNADLLVDALFGIGLSRPVEEPVSTAIQMINDTYLLGKPCLALDVPSGLHAETGEVLGHAVRARLTAAFAAPKPGMFTDVGRFYCGEIRVLPIGIPNHWVALELGRQRRS